MNETTDRQRRVCLRARRLCCALCLVANALVLLAVASGARTFVVQAAVVALLSALGIAVFERRLRRLRRAERRQVRT